MIFLRHAAWDISLLRQGARNEPESLANVGQQGFAVKRFGQITEYPLLNGGNRIGNGAMRRQNDHRQRR